MNQSPAPLSPVECSLLVEDTLAHLRHDLFNCLSAVRSASHYIEKRVSGSAVSEGDPRIARFFRIIVEQLDAAVQIFGVPPATDLPHRRSVRAVDAQACVQLAVAEAEAEVEAGSATARWSAEVLAGSALVDPDELTFAVAALLRFLGTHPGASELTLRAGPCSEGYSVRVAATTLYPPPDGPPSEAAPRLRPLSVVRRMALASAGQFAVNRQAGSYGVQIIVPSASAASENALLLVDDEIASRTTLAAVLELEGYAVRECGSLREAAAVLNAGERFSVVLLDRRLPDGDGGGFAPAVRQRLPDATLVLVSGDELEALPPGFAAAHKKGVDPMLLIGLLEKLRGSDVTETKEGGRA